MIKRGCSFIVLLIVLLLSACSSKEPRGCDRPPKEGFSESDLIGTWGGTIETAWDSTIIIRGDGKYKQAVNIKRIGFEYESDWQPWRITYSAKGLPYLHLEGLIMCAYWYQMDCSTGTTNLTPVVVGNTKDPFSDATYWYDTCRNTWVDTPGEAVFMVIGVPERFYLDRPPRGFVLVPYTKSPDGSTGPTYKPREP